MCLTAAGELIDSSFGPARLEDQHEVLWGDALLSYQHGPMDRTLDAIWWWWVSRWMYWAILWWVSYCCSFVCLPPRSKILWTIHHFVIFASLGPGKRANGCQGERRYKTIDRDKTIRYAVAQIADCIVACNNGASEARRKASATMTARQPISDRNWNIWGSRRLKRAWEA